MWASCRCIALLTEATWRARLRAGVGWCSAPPPRARGDAPSCPFPLLHAGDNDQEDATLKGVPPLASPRRAHQDPDGPALDVRGAQGVSSRELADHVEQQDACGRTD